MICIVTQTPKKLFSCHEITPAAPNHLVGPGISSFPGKRVVRSWGPKVAAKLSALVAVRVGDTNTSLLVRSVSAHVHYVSQIADVSRVISCTRPSSPLFFLRGGARRGRPGDEAKLRVHMR